MNGADGHFFLSTLGIRHDHGQARQFVLIISCQYPTDTIWVIEIINLIAKGDFFTQFQEIF